MEKFLEEEKEVKQLLHLIGRCHIGTYLFKMVGAILKQLS